MKIWRLLPLCIYILCTPVNAQERVIDQVRARLKAKEAFKKMMIQELTKGPGGKTFISLANEAATSVDEVDKLVQDIVTPAPVPVLPLEPGAATRSKILPAWVQNYFDEVVNYVITLKTREPMLPDPPPEASYDYCFPCDASRKAAYSSDTAAYIKTFFGDHGNMLSKATQVIRYFEISEDKHLPYDKEAGVRMVEKMKKDKAYLMNDLVKKVKEAWNLYKNNARQLTVLNQLVLLLHRQHQLQGIEVPADFPDLKEVGEQMFNTWTKYFNDAVMKRDYPVMLNITWYIALLRQTVLLLGNIPAQEKLFQFMQANRFEMIVDADAEIGGDGQNMGAKMKGSNYYRAIPDSVCKLRWYLYDPDEKKLQFKLEKAFFNAGSPSSYTGTMDWETPPAHLLLGFCDQPVRDTLLMQNFAPKGKEQWIIGGQTIQGNFVQGIFMNSFMDEKRVRAAAADKAKIEQFKKEIMEEYRKAVAGNEALLEKDPATMTPAEREKLAKFVNASKAIDQKMMASAVANNIIFKEALRNNVKTVFEKEIDGKTLFPKNTAIRHAMFKVQIVHVE